jgi:hypothetical protein
MAWRLFSSMLLLATPVAAEPGVKIFGRWIAACDNENVCTAIHPGWDAIDILPERPGIPLLQFRHHPFRDAIPEFRLIESGNPAPSSVLKSHAVTMVIHFKKEGRTDDSGTAYDPADRLFHASVDDKGGYRFNDEDARSIVYGLRTGERAVVSIADVRGFSFDPKPFDEVLAYFDQQQELADTPGAFVLRPDGVMYDYAHPVPPEADTVQLTRFTREQLQNWRVEYPEKLPNEIVHTEPHPDRGFVIVVRAKSKDRDCGTYERWGHVGRGNDFVLVERREMPICNGIHEDDWLRTYRADTLSPENK